MESTEHLSSLGPCIIDIQGTTLTASEQALIAQNAVGGVILFTRNFESYTQLRQLVADLRGINSRLVIAVDHEGGRVQRFKTGFTRIPAMQNFLPLYQQEPEAALQLLTDVGWLMAAELLKVGIDISYAPVLDADQNLSDIIGNRAFSPHPEDITHMAGAFMQGMHEAGMATTGKHFPGHGSVVEDSHITLPIDPRDFTRIEQHDLIPFSMLLHECNALMPAHIIFSQVDSQPVGFSRIWLHDILREKMGYKGVIFSDDLSMQGAAGVGSYTQRAQAAMQAGCDAVIVCNNPKGAEEVVRALSQPKFLSQRLPSMLAQTPPADFSDLFEQVRWLKTKAYLTEWL